MRTTFSRWASVMACLLTLGMISGTCAQDIYRYVDENGRVIFSDRPQDGGKRVKLSPTNRSSSVSVPDAGPISIPDDVAFTGYQGLRIIQPANDLLVRDNAGSLGVTVEISPELRDGDRVRLLMDGSAAGDESDTGRFQLSNVDRGSHQLQAQIIDDQDAVVLESELITVHMMRRSALHNR